MPQRHKEKLKQYH